ncbi:chemotaxis protein CheW [Tautonia sp. JC769]|uniref:chemotaxis protein CheW n=1 Tax=Tautonia sp. JC769 TaxID=3232135 RepID=UPI0034587C25
MSSASKPAGTSSPGPNADAPRAEGAVLQFVGFRLDRSDYAVAIRRVQEIILMPAITRLPQTSADVEGLMNLRGTVLPVINLRTRFGVPAKPFDEQTRVVVVNVQSRTVGILVDSVSQVMRVSEDQLQPPPPGIASVASTAIAGLFRDGDRLVIALDVDRLLADLELAAD